MSVLSENVNRTRLSVCWRERFDENVRVKTESLASAGNVRQQVLTVNQDFVFLHDVRSGLTSRAQARGANQHEPRSGTGTAIPRCLQRFVRPCRHLLSVSCSLSLCSATTRLPSMPQKTQHKIRTRPKAAKTEKRADA